jgi:Asp-tRNA(Asn)/Glu-tRNA(Gln) amidotransferase A subunit family amidase
MQNLYVSPPGLPGAGVAVSPLSGVPQLVIPLGQVPYQSTVSNITEYLPVTVSLYAAAGCDYMLWDLAAALEVSSKP